jgi:hypothetical protein
MKIRTVVLHMKLVVVAAARSVTAHFSATCV